MQAEHESEFKLTTDTPYLALMGKLWGVCYENLGENFLHHNGIALYILARCREPPWTKNSPGGDSSCYGDPPSPVSAGSSDVDWCSQKICRPLLPGKCMMERLICVNLTEWVQDYLELIQSTLLLLMSWLCPADAKSQGISSHGSDDVGLIVICQPQWWTCIRTRLSTHMNCKNCVSFSPVNQHVKMAKGNKARKLGYQQQWYQHWCRQCLMALTLYVLNFSEGT